LTDSGKSPTDIQNIITSLNTKATIGLWAGSIANTNFNDAPYGTILATGTMTNAPNDTNFGWIVMTSGGKDGSYAYKFQLAIGYNPTEVYVRRWWGTSWQAWVKLN
jgi:hypothetical protein